MRLPCLPAFSLAALAFSACLAFSVSADEGGGVESSLPRTYVGTFRWQGDPILQKVQIKLPVVQTREDGKVEARGCGRYDTWGHVTDIGIKMVLDPATHQLEIWEFDPSTKAFETDGSHAGKASTDLRLIDAVWISRSTQRAGNLRLQSGGDLTCAPEVS
jgi:hypothetical protein